MILKGRTLDYDDLKTKNQFGGLSYALDRLKLIMKAA